MRDFRRPCAVFPSIPASRTFAAHHCDANFGDFLTPRCVVRKVICRDGRPPPGGETFYREAGAILRQIEKLPATLRWTGGAPEGAVALGMSSTPASTFGAPQIDAARTAIPKVTLRLAAANSQTVRNRLRTGGLGVGFADQSHMGRHFRMIVGVTPAVYARG